MRNKGGQEEGECYMYIVVSDTMPVKTSKLTLQLIFRGFFSYGELIRYNDPGMGHRYANRIGAL